MTLRTDLLPTFNDVRSLIDNLGLRTSRVLIRTKSWSEGEVGLGDLTVTDVEILPRPKVTERGPGVVEVSRITPAFAAGGYAPSVLAPDLAANEEVEWIVIGPDGEEVPYRWAGADSRKNFGYVITLETLKREDPDF